MNKDSPPDTFAVPAAFRYVAFFDLLGDAVFLHGHATEAQGHYPPSRFARASVLASALSVECAANCLLATLDLSKSLTDEFDKMTPVGKIEAYLQLTGIEGFSRGRVEVARVVELVKARNEHVHPKAARMDGEIHAPRDGGAEWIVPGRFDGANYQNLEMPKLSMLWSASSSRAALVAVADFYAYLFRDLIKAPEHEMNAALMSRMEFGGKQTPGVHMPSLADEIRDELRGAGAFGADFSCFGLFEKGAP